MRVELTLPDETLRNLFTEFEKRLLSKLEKTKEVREIQPDRNNFLTRKEASNKLKISLPTLHNWIKSGKLRISRVGRRVLIDEKDLERFVKDLSDESRDF